MITIMNHLITTGSRPEVFRRERSSNKCNDLVNCIEASVPHRSKQIKVPSKKAKEPKSKRTKLNEPKLPNSKSNKSTKKTTSKKSASNKLLISKKVPIAIN